MTAPSGPMRSRTPRRMARGARNTGVWGSSRTSYIWRRIWRPISRVSRNPSVVTIPSRPPLRSSTALVATVVPCASWATAPGSTPCSAARRRTAAMAASPGSAGVLGTLNTTGGRPSRTHTTSVNVPPTSTPTRYRAPESGMTVGDSRAVRTHPFAPFVRVTASGQCINRPADRHPKDLRNSNSHCASRQASRHDRRTQPPGSAGICLPSADSNTVICELEHTGGPSAHMRAETPALPGGSDTVADGVSGGRAAANPCRLRRRSPARRPAGARSAAGRGPIRLCTAQSPSHIIPRPALPGRARTAGPEGVPPGIHGMNGGRAASGTGHWPDEPASRALPPTPRIQTNASIRR